MCSKIFCFDLDMTLLDHKTFHISEKVLKDLEALKKEGHVVAVATGRDMDSEFSKAYKKQLQPDAIVHSNGQKVTVGEKKIREVFMDPKLIARMMEFCREHHLCIGMNIGKYGCYVNKEVLIEHEKRIFGDGDREYIDESNLLTHPFYGLAPGSISGNQDAAFCRPQRGRCHHKRSFQGKRHPGTSGLLPERLV